MTLIKFGRADQIGEGERQDKECWDRCLALVKLNGKFYCYELPDASLAGCDVTRIPALEGVRTHTVLIDDGVVCVHLAEKPSGPIIDRTLKVPSQELIESITAADVPPPLQPIAGRVQKPMPPSPAKPFSAPASPYKPSPIKDRVDTATAAVMNKSIKSQAKRGNMFGVPPRKPVAAITADV